MARRTGQTLMGSLGTVGELPIVIKLIICLPGCSTSRLKEDKSRLIQRRSNDDDARPHSDQDQDPIEVDRRFRLEDGRVDPVIRIHEFRNKRQSVMA